MRVRISRVRCGRDSFRAHRAHGVSASSSAVGPALYVSASRALRQALEDLLQHGIDIGAYFVIPEAQDRLAVAGEKRTAPMVRLDCRRLRMLSAIQFDHQVATWATEIGDERPDWKLAPKLKSIQLPATQSHP